MSKVLSWSQFVKRKVSKENKTFVWISNSISEKYPQIERRTSKYLIIKHSKKLEKIAAQWKSDY
jgi:hypothetical protein